MCCVCVVPWFLYARDARAQGIRAQLSELTVLVLAWSSDVLIKQ